MMEKRTLKTLERLMASFLFGILMTVIFGLVFVLAKILVEHYFWYGMAAILSTVVISVLTYRSKAQV